MIARSMEDAEPPPPEELLRRLPLEERPRAVREDLDSGARRFADIDPFRLAMLLDVPVPPNYADWSYETSITVDTLEEYLQCSMPDHEDLELILATLDVTQERFEELSRMSQAALALDPPDFSFLTAAERRGRTLHFANEALESQQQNGLGCDAWYRLEAGAVELWFRGEIEDDGGCHVLHGPYEGVEAPSDDADPEVLRMPHY